MGISFLSFYVIETQSAKWREAELWSRVLPSLMKAIFERHSCFVCLCSVFGTFAYSHEHIAQKWAAPASSPIAWQSSVDFEERMRWRTQIGRAFCCTSFGLSFLYNLSWRHRSHATLRSASHLGSLCLVSLKTPAAWLRVSETVLSARRAYITWSRKLPLTHSHCKTSNNFDSVSLGHVFEGAVLGVTIPRPSFIVECVSTNCCLTGSRSRSKVSHERISFGSGTISKYCGSWEGQWEREIWVSSLSVLSLSRERAAATLLLAPWNHWLYSLIPLEIMCCMLTSHFKSNSGLDGVLAIVDWVWLPEPFFRGCAVGHQKCAVAFFESTSKDVNPWSSYCC